MRTPSAHLSNKQILALRGLRLPMSGLGRLRGGGIYCEPAISIEYQGTTKQYLLRAVESGGAVAEAGAYCGFVETTGQPLAWLERVESASKNRSHAVVVAPELARVQMCRFGQTYNLLITEHTLEGQDGKRPKLINRIVFHGVQGTLALELWQRDRRLWGQLCPAFYKKNADPLLIPERFLEAARRVTAGVRCVGCCHSHVLEPKKVNQIGKSAATVSNQEEARHG